MRKLNKDSIRKYAEFTNEALDPYKIKMGLKSFNRLESDKYTIYGDLKDLSVEISSILNSVNLPFSKLITFGGLEFDLIIKETNRYYSSVDWNKFMKDDYVVVIEVPKNYDKNYLTSIVIHEFRHIIDFTDENLNNGLSSFDMDLNLRKYNVGYFNEFYTLIYLSLEHELVARNNQIYPYIKFNNLTQDESLDILKNSFIWNALQRLKSFNVDEFIIKFDEQTLISITNSFIKDVLQDNLNTVIDSLELYQFYKLFDNYFREISDKWEKILLTEVDMVYERKVYSYNDGIIGGYKNIINDIWNKVRLGTNFFNK
jgi:hypothetical protein